MGQIKVSANSIPNKVAAAISNLVRQDGSVEVACIGAGATNQAVKAIAVATGYAASSGIDLINKVSFGETSIDGESRTYMKITCMGR